MANKQEILDGLSPAEKLEILKSLPKRDLERFLEKEPRVREWLAKQLKGAADAANVLDVDRPRVWRWEQAGRIARIATVAATPVYLLCDLRIAKVSDPPQKRRRTAASKS